MKECLANCFSGEHKNTLRNAGYFIGWLMVALRAVAILTLAVVISQEPRDIPANLDTVLHVLLAYAFISLGANFLLIIGISKANPYYSLPYLGVHGIELFAGVIILTGGIILVVKLETSLVPLSYIIPTGIVGLGSYSLCWYWLFALFRYHEELTSENSVKNYSCLAKLCHCRRTSDSIDISVL